MGSLSLAGLDLQGLVFPKGPHAIHCERSSLYGESPWPVLPTSQGSGHVDAQPGWLSAVRTPGYYMGTS